MATAFRVTDRDGGGLIGDADTINGVIELAKAAPPGRYRIDNISHDRHTGELRAWELGEIEKGPAGEIKLDLPPWFD
jgi:hypothetical protein